MVQKISNNDMSEVKKQAFAVVDFSAEWCQPCHMLAPVLDEVAEELDGQASFYNVDVDANGDLALEYGIRNIPALVFLKDGEVVGKNVGFLPKPQLQEVIDSYRK